MNTAYIAGIVCGVLAVALICWIIARINKKKGNVSKEYDERQRAIRDKGFRYAYLTLVGYMLLIALLHALDVFSGDVGGWLFIGVILSLTVHVVYSIYKDAYFRVSDSPRSYIVLFGVLGPINLVVGAVKRITGEVEGAFPTYGDLNLIVGVMVVIVAVNILIKLKLDRHSEEN